MERYELAAMALLSSEKPVPLNSAQIKYLREKLDALPASSKALICDTFKHYRGVDNVEGIIRVTPGLSKAIEELRAITSLDVMSLGLKTNDQVTRMVIDLLERQPKQLENQPEDQETAAEDTPKERNEGELLAIKDFWHLTEREVRDHAFIKDQCEKVIESVHAPNYVDFMVELVQAFKEMAPEIYKRFDFRFDGFVELLQKYQHMTTIEPRVIAYFCDKAIYEAKYPERMMDFTTYFLGEDSEAKTLSTTNRLGNSGIYTIDDLLMKYIWGFDFKRHCHRFGAGAMTELHRFFDYYIGEMTLDELKVKFPVDYDSEN